MMPMGMGFVFAHAALLLAVSFFVVFALNKVNNGKIVILGWVTAAFLWIAAALVLVGGLCCPPCGMGPMGRSMKCGQGFGGPGGKACMGNRPMSGAPQMGQPMGEGQPAEGQGPAEGGAPGKAGAPAPKTGAAGK